jgi:hypothetical protein
VAHLASDAHDGHHRHLVGQRSHVVRVAGEQPSRLGQRVRRDRDDGIDGVVSASPPEELSGGATDVWGDRVLLDGGKKRVNSRVATVTPEHLGEGYAADVDARTDLLSDRELSSHSRITTSARANRTGVKDDRGRDAGQP